jgi:hypothetical protein
MVNIVSCNAVLAARYGIVQPSVAADTHLTRRGIGSADAGDITVMTRRRALSNADKLRLCELACAQIGAKPPRFNRRRVRLLESLLESSISRAKAA